MGITKTAIITMLIFMAQYGLSWAHSGRTNAEGCHNNRKTGDYHCHNSGNSSRGSSSSSYDSYRPKPYKRPTPSYKKSSPPKRTYTNRKVYSCKGVNGHLTITNEPCSEEKRTAKSTKSYSRKSWPHWIDADKDCQNTRAEILIRDSIGDVKFKRNRGCNVSWGRWFGPYTGETFTKASDVDIDHIVPLEHAHRTGGGTWSRERKRQFANDPENLLTVDDSTNQAKGSKGPARWKPPRKAYWCEYARRWRRIKGKYGLTISVPEERSIRVMERTCS